LLDARRFPPPWTVEEKQAVSKEDYGPSRGLLRANVGDYTALKILRCFSGLPRPHFHIGFCAGYLAGLSAELPVGLDETHNNQKWRARTNSRRGL
jgi:hypothetical protein